MRLEKKPPIELHASAIAVTPGIEKSAERNVESEKSADRSEFKLAGEVLPLCSSGAICD
jgi:hypothetical protein